MTSRRSEEKNTIPSHPYAHTPVTRRVVITHDIVDGVDRVTRVALEADPGEQLPDVDLTAWAGAFTVETSIVGDEREVILRFPDCGAEHVPVIERRRLCTPGGGTVTSRRAFHGQDHSDGQESPRPIDPADIRPGDVVELGLSEPSDELTRAIAEVTEGKDREGTAKWPQCCRDTYSLAIEEIAAALAPLIEARVREARADAWDEGHAIGAQDQVNLGRFNIKPTPNPYRKDETDA